jgi:hypothetical protein
VRRFPDVPSAEHYELVHARLRQALQALAAAADAQVASLPDFAQWNAAAELANDLDSWQAVIVQNYPDALSVAEHDRLRALDERRVVEPRGAARGA